MREIYDNDYSWQDEYLKAVCETDDTKRMSRIINARFALEERLFDPAGIDDQEYDAIKRAISGLHALRAERVDGDCSSRCADAASTKTVS